MSKKHFIIEDDQPPGHRILITTDSDEIAKEFKESAELANIDVKQLTVFTNDDLNKKKK